MYVYIYIQSFIIYLFIYLSIYLFIYLFVYLDHPFIFEFQPLVFHGGNLATGYPKLSSRCIYKLHHLGTGQGFSLHPERAIFEKPWEMPRRAECCKSTEEVKMRNGWGEWKKIEKNQSSKELLLQALRYF